MNLNKTKSENLYRNEGKKVGVQLFENSWFNLWLQSCIVTEAVRSGSGEGYFGGWGFLFVTRLFKEN